MKSDNPAAKTIAIIGGGITGLAAAYSLQKQARVRHLPINFSLFESAPRLGGKVYSEQVDGFTVEAGPDSFLQQKPWAVQLAQELGLEPDLIGTHPTRNKVYVVNHGRLIPMPEGAMLVIPTRFMPFITSPLISWPGKLRMGLDFFIPPRQGDEDESMGAFFRRRLGQEALDKLAEPLLSGIHVSDPDRQSLLATFPRFRDIEKQHGSLIRGMLALRHDGAAHTARRDSHSWKGSPFVSLRQGMGRLASALEQALAGGQVHAGCRVTGLQPLPEGGYHLATADGEVVHADGVILATPAYVSAELVSAFAPALARGLSTIRYVSTATVNLAYHQLDVRERPDMVGFIIPRSEKRKLTACTISSTKFAGRAPEGDLLVRCFLGGPGHEDAVKRDDAAIIADAREELAALAGIRAEPAGGRVYRWFKGHPQYEVGHLERIRRLHAQSAGFPGLYLAGSAYEGVGVPDCIHQGQLAAEKSVAFATDHFPDRPE